LETRIKKRRRFDSVNPSGCDFCSIWFADLFSFSVHIAEPARIKKRRRFDSVNSSKGDFCLIRSVAIPFSTHSNKQARIKNAVVSTAQFLLELSFFF
jgi:hypothetical protein